MIPFASQRGGGQDLATHLMNAHDNEQIDLLEVRGAVARDLHGALAEWEAIAGALTRCRQYLCSLSINPDERQGRLTRDQYLDYIARAEAALGLAGQPRAIIFHVKQDGHGRMREHCHVVWSRIDVEKKRAVPLSFFKEKIMAVTRAFARDHGLALPPGYDAQEGKRRRNRQLSAYDCIKQIQTGVSHEERMAAVTDAWQRSDCGRAFARALAELGYILAQGRNKTRVVLVDFYGHTTALTRLIDDPSVRAKHVRDFLGLEYAPGKLPTVEQAQEITAQRRKLVEAFEAAQAAADEAETLAHQQEERRQALEDEAAALRQRQHEQRMQLAAAQKAARQSLQSAYFAERKRIRVERAQRKPTGLAAFLGRVTGIALITRKVQRYRDRKRYGAYLALRAALKHRQHHKRDVLARGHELQATALSRKLRALDQIEKRERQTLETAALKERRQTINARHVHMPSLAPALRQQDGTGARESRAPLAQEFERRARQTAQEAQVRLTQAFARASGAGKDDSSKGGSTKMPALTDDMNIQRRRLSRRARKERDRQSAALLSAFNDAARGGEGDSDDGRSESALAPAAKEKIRRRKRRRRRLSLDQEFNSAAGARDNHGDSNGGPRSHSHSRGQDPPDGDGPRRPPGKRRRDFGRGM